jgi:hypothetical protein
MPFEWPQSLLSHRCLDWRAFPRRRKAIERNNQTSNTAELQNVFGNKGRRKGQGKKASVRLAAGAIDNDLSTALKTDVGDAVGAWFVR